MKKHKSKNVEEMNVYGYTKLGVLESSFVDALRDSVLNRKAKEIEVYGEQYLRDKGCFDLIRSTFEFTPPWLSVIESDWLNDFLNESLNETAILHDVFCLFNTDGSNQSLTRNKFHRDQPWFKDTRTSIAVFILLADTSSENGPTEVVPSTHLFEERPSDEFLDSNIKQLTGPKGQVYAMDASLWHRAGRNLTGVPRPLVNMRFQLSFMKRPIDLCKVHEKELEAASELVQARFGWFSRSVDSVDELFEKKKWFPGQYDVSNTNVHS